MIQCHGRSDSVGKCQGILQSGRAAATITYNTQCVNDSRRQEGSKKETHTHTHKRNSLHAVHTLSNKTNTPKKQVVLQKGKEPRHLSMKIKRDSF